MAKTKNIVLKINKFNIDITFAILSIFNIIFCLYSLEGIIKEDIYNEIIEELEEKEELESEKEELEGLDAHEHGMDAYPDFRLNEH